MQAILKFELPKDEEQLDVAIKATDLYLSLFDLDQKFREYLKHGHDFKTADEALEAMWDNLHEIMTDHGVSLDMMS